MPIPTYPWFDQVPEHLKTRNQLGELGLKPGGPIVATVEWDRGRKYAYLYDVGQAVEKRKISDAYRAKLEAQKLARRTCPVCKRVFDHVLYSDVCESCHDYYPDGTPRKEDGSLYNVERGYRVWLPLDSPLDPIDVPVPETWRYYHWVPYPKTVFHMLLQDGPTGPHVPNHTHGYFFGRLFGEQLAEWDAATFAEHAERWPILREWAIDTSLPGSKYLNWAMAGLEGDERAEMRVLWYEKRLEYHEVMKKYSY